MITDIISTRTGEIISSHNSYKEAHNAFLELVGMPRERFDELNAILRSEYNNDFEAFCEDYEYEFEGWQDYKIMPQWD